jgi:23S rRNA (guanosine2251-2'-O)-methyltransferase
MSNKIPPRTMSDKHNTFHAEKRRARRDASQGSQQNRYPRRPNVAREENEKLYLYGLHTVRQAVSNAERKKICLYATTNGLSRLEFDLIDAPDLEIIEKHPRDLDKMVGSDAVHQGVVLEVSPVATKSLSELKDANLLLVLDQVTDPHNVGAIMRSAVAMGAGALITTSRYSPVESGVLAKSASGAVDIIDHIEVKNLADALETLHENGFFTIGLDSEEAIPFEEVEAQKKIALVLGAEGKGLRQKTRDTVSQLARLDMPGEIKSLNVSNAAVLALYISRQKLTA